MNKNKNKNIQIGFTKGSEILNGRIAMISFVVIVLIELIFKQPILTLIR